MIAKTKNLTRYQKNAKIAITNRLFVSGWCLNEDLHDIVKNHSKNSIVELHYEDDIPVGVAVYHMGLLQMFVRAAYRRRGIGTKLVDKIRDKIDNNPCHGTGISGSEHFWKKVLNKA